MYASPEVEWVDRSVGYPDIAGLPYFREWKRACLKDRGTKQEELSEDSWGFHSMQNEGIMVISRLPFEIEDILCISEGAEEWHIDRGNGETQIYKLVSDVYEVTEKSPDSNYATVMHVSEDFMDQYEGTLYILSRNRETGEVKLVKDISPQRELDLLPEDEFDRDYKIHSNGTCGMSAGFQYAIAERKGKAGE